MFLLAGFVFMVAAQPSWAGAGVPVPPRKPVAEKVSVVRYSLKDFAKALLDFGTPPAPAAKPPKNYEGPLTEVDAERYSRVFKLQDSGKITEADKEMAALKDWRLRGHVLYQRYLHPTAYKSSFEELRNWLSLYSDHPGAPKIYQLALRKNPGGENQMKKPQGAKGITSLREPMTVEAKDYKSPLERSAAETQTVKSFKSAVSSMARGQPADALEKFQSDKTTKLLDDVEKDILQSQIATGFMHTGRLDEAYKLASKSADRSGVKVPQAGWVAGLVSWQDGHYKRAAKYFEIMAESPYASSWSVAGGSYWAARAHMRSGNVRAVSKWLERAMEHPRTFYGLVATRALGQDFEFNWHVPTFTKEYLDILTSTPSGHRAVALMAAEQPDLAQAELLRLDPRSNDDLRDAMLAYSAYARLPALAMRIGASGAGNVNYDAALYPMGPWQPKDGYKIDPALIYAIMRQESRFDPDAQSPSGARGLMQLMPKTASAIARKHGGMEKLMDPETNLAMGQQYLGTLLKDKNVKNDLLSLLIAYNAGPGNLSRWKKNWPEVKDPLLFIELIPASETRAYVERVLANYWIYRLREGLPTPSLDAVAAGKAARYAGFDPSEKSGFRLAAAE